MNDMRNGLNQMPGQVQRGEPPFDRNAAAMASKNITDSAAINDPRRQAEDNPANSEQPPVAQQDNQIPSMERITQKLPEIIDEASKYLKPKDMEKVNQMLNKAVASGNPANVMQVLDTITPAVVEGRKAVEAKMQAQVGQAPSVQPTGEDMQNGLGVPNDVGPNGGYTRSQDADGLMQATLRANMPR